MCYEDFCNYWTSVEICKVFYKEKYLKQQFEGEFSQNLRTNETYAFVEGCPQYLLVVEGNQAKKFTISLLQTDKRVLSNKKSRNICHGIRIYKTDDGKKMKKVISNLIASVQFWTRDREVVLETNLDPGRYVIIPSTHKPNMESKYWIRVYTDGLFSLDQLNPTPNPKESLYNINIEGNKRLKASFLKMNNKSINQQQIKDNMNNQQINQQINQQNLIINIQKNDNIQVQYTNNNLTLCSAQDIYLSNNNLTATFSAKSDGARTFYGSKLYETGNHYFAFKIEATTNPSNIMIGVVDPYVHKNLLAFLSHGPRGYAFYGYNGTVYHNFQSKPYGAKWSKGDEIGVSIDYNQGLISFYLNGKTFGPCYSGVQGPFVAAVTLYSPGDSVTLIPNAQLPKPQSRDIQSLKHGSKIFLKNNWGSYMTYNQSGQPTVSKSITPACYFTVIKTQNGYQFQNSKGFKLTAHKDETVFYVTELSSLNTYQLQSTLGVYLGMNKNGGLLLYTNNSLSETRWFISQAKENLVFNILKQGDVIALKSYYGTYFGYLKNGSPIASTQKSQDTTFTVYRNGDYYQLKSSHGFFAVSAKSDQNLFKITQHKSGYSLEINGKYLGISNDGKVKIYDNDNNWESRFYPESVSQGDNKSQVELSHGSKIAFKTIWGNYFYYNQRGNPIAGPLDQLSIFTVETHGTGYRFATPNRKYACTTSGNVLFKVYKFKNGVSIKSGDFYLGVTKDGHVKLYKNEDDVTCFVIENYQNLQKQIEDSVTEKISQMDLNQQIYQQQNYQQNNTQQNYNQQIYNPQNYNPQIYQHNYQQQNNNQQGYISQNYHNTQIFNTQQNYYSQRNIQGYNTQQNYQQNYNQQNSLGYTHNKITTINNKITVNKDTCHKIINKDTITHKIYSIFNKISIKVSHLFKEIQINLITRILHSNIK